jgi:hypothetical protein
MRISRDASGALAAAGASVGAGGGGVASACCALSVEWEKRHVVRPRAKVAANLQILIIVGWFLDVGVKQAVSVFGITCQRFCEGVGALSE